MILMTKKSGIKNNINDMIKNYINFLNEADDFGAPAAQAPPAQDPLDPNTPPAQETPAQPAQSGTTQAQSSGSTQGQATQGEQKVGDLSNYSNENATKFTDTVKKMAEMLKDMDKTQLIAVRDCIAKQKGIDDPKSEIGKL